MKYLICSDIHGSIESAEFIVNKFKELNCRKIICLGDVLYHGPRNDIPENYAPKKVIELLNENKDFIACVQGNCDAEVDQMVLNFKMQKTLNGFINDKLCHFEHGHHIEELSTNCQFVFYGHTHISLIEEKDEKIFFNPGSITLPKEGQKRSYMVWDERTITLYDMDGNILNSYKY